MNWDSHLITWSLQGKIPRFTFRVGLDLHVSIKKFWSCLPNLIHGRILCQDERPIVGRVMFMSHCQPCCHDSLYTYPFAPVLFFVEHTTIWHINLHYNRNMWPNINAVMAGIRLVVQWDVFIVSCLIASIATIVLYCVFCMCLSKFHKLEACTYSVKHGYVKCHSLQRLKANCWDRLNIPTW